VLLFPQPRPPSGLPVGLLPPLPPVLNLGLEVHVVFRRPGLPPGPEARTGGGAARHGHLRSTILFAVRYSSA
jgi:hypothetical protein